MNKTYVMSDIHGCFYTFKNMLEKIQFDTSDTLYIIGDVVDRGGWSIDLIYYIMDHKNIIYIAGNHEHMMLDALHMIDNPEDKSISEEDRIIYTYDWWRNGGKITYDKFKKETEESKLRLIEYLKSISEYKIIEIEDKKYLLIHAGLFIPENKKVPENIDLEKLIEANIDKQLHLYIREDFIDAKEYITDMTIIFGHTPVIYIPEYIGLVSKKITKDNLNRCNNNKIYKTKHKIGIDCGCATKNGQLGCLRLDDFKEFYIKKDIRDCD